MHDAASATATVGVYDRWSRSFGIGWQAFKCAPPQIIPNISRGTCCLAAGYRPPHMRRQSTLLYFTLPVKQWKRPRSGSSQVAGECIVREWRNFHCKGLQRGCTRCISCTQTVRVDLLFAEARGLGHRGRRRPNHKRAHSAQRNRADECQA